MLTSGFYEITGGIQTHTYRPSGVLELSCLCQRPQQSCSVGKLRWESALLPLTPGPYWKQRPVLPLACVQDTVILGLPLSTAKLLGLNKVEIGFFHHLSDWRSSRPEWGHQSGLWWLPWFRLAIESQNKTRNGFISTTKTCDLDQW